MLASPALLARFNAWANRRLHAVAAKLPAEEISKDRGAFFGSILGTLNHILLVDLLYRDRIEGVSGQFQRLDEILHSDLHELTKAQAAIDAHFREYAEGLNEADLASDIVFTTLLDDPEEWRVPLHVYLTNLAQHQVHHRGQVHTLLTQARVEVPPIGFIEYCMDRERGLVSHRTANQKTT